MVYATLLDKLSFNTTINLGILYYTIFAIIGCILQSHSTFRNDFINASTYIYMWNIWLLPMMIIVFMYIKYKQIDWKREYGFSDKYIWKNEYIFIIIFYIQIGLWLWGWKFIWIMNLVHKTYPHILTLILAFQFSSILILGIITRSIMKDDEYISVTNEEV